MSEIEQSIAELGAFSDLACQNADEKLMIMNKL